VEVACGTTQLTLQSLQWSIVVTFVSQPSIGLPVVQLRQPWRHVYMHVDDMHVSVVFVRVPQGISHPPQFMTSEVVSVHPLRHRVPGQFSAHRYPVAVLMHISGSGGAVSQDTLHEPHVPVEDRAVSQPLLTFASQLPHPESHTKAHRPVVHTGTPWTTNGPVGQALPHVPQWVSDRVTSVSHPVPGIVSQSANPASHPTIAQVPVEQDSIAFARSHTIPQPPQFVSSRCRDSQPVDTIVSHSWYPSSHA
jgi:hypothetical protein